MMKTAKQLAEKKVDHRWQKGFLWVSVLALPLAMKLAVPSLENHDAILGAFTEHDIPTIVTDGKGWITFANMPAMQLLGGDIVPDVWGHNITEWMDEKVAETHKNYFHQEEAMPLGATRPMDSFLMVDGQQVPVSVEVTPGEVEGDRIYRLEFRRTKP